ncbi:MAG: hypothetical protein IKR86_00990 [Candidatus Methanomethylophilaceae archaeon]|nr:hypothetical protein [Candidatus Methanomethylophilaceae archaeon]
MNLSLELSRTAVPPSSYETHIPTAPSGDRETPSTDRNLPLSSSHWTPLRYASASLPSEASSSP